MLLLDWVFFEWKLCQKDSSNKVKLNSLFSKSIKENIKSIINFKKNYHNKQLKYFPNKLEQQIQMCNQLINLIELEKPKLGIESEVIFHIVRQEAETMHNEHSKDGDMAFNILTTVLCSSLVAFCTSLCVEVAFNSNSSPEVLNFLIACSVAFIILLIISYILYWALSSLIVKIDSKYSMKQLEDFISDIDLLISMMESRSSKTN